MLVGITLATAVVHAVSVAIGYGLGSALPTGWIALVAAIAFVGFGAWTLRGDALTDDERTRAERSTGSAVVAASVAFFLAELGDKTMLATITLATQHGWFGTWLGSTLGMVAADALAIAVGRQLGRHLPERAIGIGASALFFLFGAWLLVDALAQLNRVSPADAVAAALDHHLAGWIALGLGLVTLALGTWGRRRMRRVGAVSRPVRRPAAAQAQRVALQERGADPVSATRGLHARVRNPGLAGIVLATAGLLLMVPTLLGVLAAVLVVVAVQVQVRAVREPVLADRHGPAYAAYAARTGRFLPRPGTDPDAEPDPERR